MKKSTNQNDTNLVTQKDLETWGETLTDRIDSVENNLSTRIDSVEKKMSDMNDRMMTGFDKVMKRLDDIDTNLTLNMHDTEKLKTRITALEHRKN